MRRFVTTAVTALAFTLAGCGQQAGTGPDRTTPRPPVTGSPSANPSAARPAPPSATARRGAVRETDWRDVTLTRVPASVCSGGTIRFRGGTAEVGTDPDQATTWLVLLFDERPAYGDVDGDGAEDAVLTLGCYTGRPDHPTIFLAAVRADGSTRRVFGVAGRESHMATFRSYRVEGRTVVAVVYDGATDVVKTKRYRWNGTTFG